MRTLRPGCAAQLTIRKCVDKAGLDEDVVMSAQDPVKIGQICQAVRASRLLYAVLSPSTGQGEAVVPQALQGRLGDD